MKGCAKHIISDGSDENAKEVILGFKVARGHGKGCMSSLSMRRVKMKKKDGEKE